MNATHQRNRILAFIRLHVGDFDLQRGVLVISSWAWISWILRRSALLVHHHYHDHGCVSHFLITILLIRPHFKFESKYLIMMITLRLTVAASLNSSVNAVEKVAFEGALALLH